jgi:hypothetical protein
MKMKTTKSIAKRPLGALASALLLALCTSNSFASAIGVESGDAGQLTGTAQTFAGSGVLAAIRGAVGSGDMADMFRIYLQAGQAFSATTTASALAFNNFDTSLFLFDITGRGLIANDDDPGFGPTSTISSYLPGASGFYYLAIAGTGFTPSSAGGNIFGNLIGQDQVGPTGPGGALPLTGWTSITSEGDLYEILLTNAAEGAPSNGTVPEPGTWLLLTLGLCAGAAARRLRRTRDHRVPLLIQARSD